MRSNYSRLNQIYPTNVTLNIMGEYPKTSEKSCNKLQQIRDYFVYWITHIQINTNVQTENGSRAIVSARTFIDRASEDVSQMTKLQKNGLQNNAGEINQLVPIVVVIMSRLARSIQPCPTGVGIVSARNSLASMLERPCKTRN